jgi:hypothetical protein
MMRILIDASRAFDQTKGYIEKLITTKVPEAANTLAVEIRKYACQWIDIHDARFIYVYLTI